MLLDRKARRSTRKYGAGRRQMQQVKKEVEKGKGTPLHVEHS